MEKLFIFVVIVIITANGIVKADHHDCHGKDCIIVDLAIQIIETNFDHDLCHAFEDVDCAKHVLANDEQICGSDGHTYRNHCFFAKARCDRILNKHNYHHHQLTNPLLIVSYGPCGVSTPATALTSKSLGIVTVKDDNDDDDDDDCDGKECIIVNLAIQNIGSNFDKDICHAFKHVDCDNHELTMDEKICGSDGHTYSSHCSFAKARCDIILDKHNYVHHTLSNPLLIAAHGPCGVSTTHPSPQTTMVSNFSSALTKATSVSTNSGHIVSSTITPAKPSTIPVSATKTLVSTTVPSTTVSTHQILGSVFCQYKASINCGIALAVVCGSDGNFYPNMCELLKAQCGDATVRQNPDVSHCSLPP